MKTKVKDTKGYSVTNTNEDGITLLTMIREVMCGMAEHLQHM